MKTALDERILRKGIKDPNQTKSKDETHCVDRRINRDALSRDSPAPLVRCEVGKGLLAVRAKLKKGKEHFEPMTPEMNGGDLYELAKLLGHAISR
jgi:hypothetical protein